MPSADAYLFLALIACAIDALLLGVLYQAGSDRATRLAQQAVLGGSHVVFAGVGFALMRLGDVASPVVVDGAVIAGAAIVAGAGWYFSTGRQLGSACLIAPTVAAGLDALLVGAYVEASGASITLMLIGCALIPPLAFGAPAVLAPRCSERSTQFLA